MTLPFDELYAQIMALYQAGDYAKVLELVTRYADDYPERDGDLTYWRLCMTARLKDPEETCQLLEELLDTGYWFAEVILRESPSLAPLVGMPEYERLVARSAEITTAAAQEVASKVVVVEPEERDGPYPLLLALHGNSSAIGPFKAEWLGPIKGWLQVFPQASVPVMKGAYNWAERDVVIRDIVAHYQAICQDYPVDPDRVVIAGHSMGGSLAIWLALSHAIRVQGFIALGPYLPDEEISTWMEAIEAATGTGLRGVMLLGEEDNSIPHEGIHTLTERLNSRGIPCKVVPIPGAGHEIGAGYRQQLAAALQFVVYGA